MENNLIIFPDIHGHSFWKKAIKDYPSGQFVFLGDNLDPYPDEGIDDTQAFHGLQEIIQLKKDHPGNVVLLWGNHDLHYIYPGIRGSRYDFEHAERNAHLFLNNQMLFQIAYETEAGGKRFLFTHAGIGRLWLLRHFSSFWGQQITAQPLNDLVGSPRFMKALEDVSFFRGGDRPWGSIVWADVHEHIEQVNQIPGVVQIFGHTQVNRPLNWANLFYCLDVKRTFLLDRGTGSVRDMESGRIIEPAG